MKDWHVKHMEKTIVKYVSGLAPDASAWERKNHTKYVNFSNTCRQIDYDIKHGVTSEQVVSFLGKVRHNASYSKVRKNDGSMDRLVEVEKYFHETIRQELPQRRQVKIRGSGRVAGNRVAAKNRSRQFLT
jgi:hypothetical protein